MLRTQVDFWRGLNTIEKKENTSRVCSRHFREGDIKKSFSGKNEVKHGVVPPVILWIRTSPRKRKEPMQRYFEETASLKASWKMSSSVVVMEELSNEMLPDVLDLAQNLIT